MPRAFTLLCLMLVPPLVAAPERALPLSLEAVFALDPRLPGPDAQDVEEIVRAAQSCLAGKFSPPVLLRLAGRESMDVSRLFELVDYRASPRFAELEPFRYDLVLGKKAKNFQDPAYMPARVEFLENWSLESLRRLFPYRKWTSHANVANALMQEYHRRIAWLKGLHRPGGESLVLLPPVPHQSLTHWDAWASVQDRHDLVLTNGLIILDTTASPYPHAVLKHAKSGGGTLNCPARQSLGGMALVVSVLEDFVAVPSIGQVCPQRNRIIGEVLLAHEIAHAFFGMPDTYDHGDVCLMNSNAHALDNARILELLDRNPGPCARCRPYVESKQNVLAARDAMSRGMFDLAASAYARAIAVYPAREAGSQGAIYFPRLEEEARRLRAFTPPSPRTPPRPPARPGSPADRGSSSAASRDPASGSSPN